MRAVRESDIQQLHIKDEREMQTTTGRTIVLAIEKLVVSGDHVVENGVWFVCWFVVECVVYMQTLKYKTF